MKSLVRHDQLPRMIQLFGSEVFIDLADRLTAEGHTAQKSGEAPPMTVSGLLAAWEAAQGSAETREQRTGCLLDVLAARSRELARPLRVLDLGCGPGLMTRAVLSRFPDSTVVGIDHDPVLLRLARETSPFPDRVRWVDADLRDGSWLEDTDGAPYDAAISSTGLCRLHADELTWLHRLLAHALTPGGLYLNAARLRFDETSEPWLARVSQEVGEAPRPDRALAWDLWWETALAMPGWEDEAEERGRRPQEPAPAEVGVDFHVASLRAAGFVEAAQVWQRFDERIVFGRISEAA